MTPLKMLPTTSCTCATCVAMCENCPCWPTPSEAAAIIRAGHAKRLTLEWWEGNGDSERPAWYILAPARVGYEGKRAPANIGGLLGLFGIALIGRCTFLTPASRCALHRKGLKPIEGRISSCVESAWMADREASIDLHERVARTWNTKRGKVLVRRWRRMMGL